MKRPDATDLNSGEAKKLKMSESLAVPPPADKLLIQKLSDKARTPTRGSSLAAGYDLYRLFAFYMLRLA